MGDVVYCGWSYNYLFCTVIITAIKNTYTKFTSIISFYISIISSLFKMFYALIIRPCEETR